MRTQYFLTPLLVMGVVGGVLAGIPGCCYGSFLWGGAAGFLAVYWGKSRGAIMTGLGEPTLTGVFSGLAGGVTAMILFPLLVYIFAPMLIHYFESLQPPRTGVSRPVGPITTNEPDEETPPAVGQGPTSSGAPPAGVIAAFSLIYAGISAFVYALFATLGGLLGGAIFQQKDYVPPPEAPPMSAPPASPA